MGGLMGGPKMPKMKPPKMPDTPRLRGETDPDVEKRSRLKLAQKRRGRAATLLSDRSRTTNQITRQSLGGGTGNQFPGLK